MSKSLLLTTLVSIGFMLCLGTNTASSAQSDRDDAIRKLLNIGDGSIETTPITVKPEHQRMGPYVSGLAEFDRQMKECLRLLYLQGRSSMSLITCTVFDEFNHFIDLHGSDGMKGEAKDLTEEQNRIAKEVGGSIAGVVRGIQILMGM